MSFLTRIVLYCSIIIFLAGIFPVSVPAYAATQCSFTPQWTKDSSGNLYLEIAWKFSELTNLGTSHVEDGFSPLITNDQNEIWLDGYISSENDIGEERVVLFKIPQSVFQNNPPYTYYISDLDFQGTSCDNAGFGTTLPEIPASTEPLPEAGTDTPENHLSDQCADAKRKDECYAARAAGEIGEYKDDPCFSIYSKDFLKEDDGTPTYDSQECKTKRGTAACAQGKTIVDGKEVAVEGGVYVRAFGFDPENACVGFLGFTKTLVDYALLLASIIAGYMLIMGGFKYTMSKGNPVGLMEARDQILHATIGLILLTTSFIIILFLQGNFSFLGLNLVGPFSSVFGN